MIESWCEIFIFSLSISVSISDYNPIGTYEWDL